MADQQENSQPNSQQIRPASPPDASAVDVQVLQKAKQLLPHIGSYPDFPKPGILFRDFFPIIQNPSAFELLIDLLVQHVQAHHSQVDAVFGLEARGFLIGPHLAQRLKVGFLPIRKAGKLPGPVHRYTYTLEYGSDTLEVQSGRLPANSKCLIVDDLLATGGTLHAANHLLKQNGLDVLESLIVMELCELNGRRALENEGARVFSLLKF